MTNIKQPALGRAFMGSRKMEKMVNLRLKGKTRKGKNRIKEHGEVWKIVRVADFVELDINGPGLLVEAVGCKCVTCQRWGSDWRWIAWEDDKDFLVVAEGNKII